MGTFGREPETATALSAARSARGVLVLGFTSKSLAIAVALSGRGAASVLADPPEAGSSWTGSNFAACAVSYPLVALSNIATVPAAAIATSTGRTREGVG